MAWKRSTVRTRPGPPKQFKHLAASSAVLIRAAEPKPSHFFSGSHSHRLPNRFDRHQEIEHLIDLLRLPLGVRQRVQERQV